MTDISCVVVDDEPLAVKLIENFIGRTPFLHHVASYTDSITASVELDRHKVDLIFLDIQMPDLDGMSLARMVGPSTKIVFTTAFAEYALDSYDVAALDFLVKPIRYDRFLRAAKKALDWHTMRNGGINMPEKEAQRYADKANDKIKEEIFIKYDGVYRRIRLHDLILIEGMKDYVRLYVEGEKFPITTHMTMKSVEETLPRDRFMRVSRSHIVALRRIRSIDRNLCIYIGDTMIKVTDMYRSEIEAFIRSNTLGRP